MTVARPSVMPSAASARANSGRVGAEQTDEYRTRRRAADSNRARDCRTRSVRARRLHRQQHRDRDPRDGEERAAARPPTHERARRDRRNEEQHRLLDRKTARTYGVSGRNRNAASARRSLPHPRSVGAGAAPTPKRR